MIIHGDEGWSFDFEKNPLWKLKLKLQQTGWLQYMMPTLFATIFILPAAIVEYILFKTTKVCLPVVLTLYFITIFDIHHFLSSDESLGPW